MDRFYVLLAAEQHHPEAAAMHGLFVFTYYAQHLSLCMPWLREAHREWMRGIFVDGGDWREVMSWPGDRARRQGAVDRAKERSAGATETPAAGYPVTGEMTVADLGTPGSPDYPSGYPTKVESWARSVADHRFP